MDDGSQIVGSIIFIVLLLFNFLVYGFSAAIQTINYKVVVERSDSGDGRAKQIAQIIETPGKFINSLRVLFVIFLLYTGCVTFGTYSQNLADWFNNKGWVPLGHNVTTILSYLIVGVVLLFIVICFGIIMPKRLGGKYADTWAFSLFPTALLFMTFFSPITSLCKFSAYQILRIFGISPKEEFENVTEEEIKSMVNEGHEKGVIEASEAKMIANIFEFGDKQAQDIMTHRKSIVAINGDMTLAEAVKFILDENNSRFPVFIDDIDNIIGVLHLKDAMIFLGRDENHYENTKIKDIPDFLRNAEFVPETRNIDDLFKTMQSAKIHMVIIIDEYGQTSGIITMEDILEEIVGNILDEYDEEERNILSHKGNVYVVKGMTPIDELTDELNIEFEEDEYDTLNGFLVSKLDRIPKDDERPEIDVDGILYKVLNIENRTISLVKITIPETKDEKEKNEENEEN